MIEITSVERIKLDTRSKANARRSIKHMETFGGELKATNNTWRTVEKMAKDRQKLKTFVAVLHAIDIPGSK